MVCRDFLDPEVHYLDVNFIINDIVLFVHVFVDVLHCIYFIAEVSGLPYTLSK